MDAAAAMSGGVVSDVTIAGATRRSSLCNSQNSSHMSLSFGGLQNAKFSRGIKVSSGSFSDKRSGSFTGSHSCSLTGKASPSGLAIHSLGASSYAETTFDSYPRVAEEKIGVLLLNLGGPETLQDVQPFLYNLFADPDIIRLPRLFRFLQQPIAKLISIVRAPKSREGYASIGGGSPLRRMTNEQADALRRALETKDVMANVYIAMRYWYPFTEEAVQQIKRDKITKLVVLPLYPQFSISTTGSSIRALENAFR